MINVIELVLSLLGLVLGQLKAVPGVVPEIITAIENAIAELQKVQGSDVTWAQLESLKVQPKW